MPDFPDAEERRQVSRQIAFPEAEAQLRLLIENLRDYAIFTVDTQGRVASWNAGTEHIEGYRADEILGKHFSIFYTQEDLRARKPWADLEGVTREGQLELEGWRVRKDGSRFWASVVITALRDAHERPGRVRQRGAGFLRTQAR